ncbi:hypothetical protein ACIPRI_12595 [Variovorax sp. LARHSF232]
MKKQDPSKPRTPMYPRDNPGSFSVPATKGGSIQRMVGLRDFMEIYTEHETFRFQTPESIDPARTNPNAMFSQWKVADVGSSSPYIARTILMAEDMLSNRMVLSDTKLEDVMMLMHRIKETLLQCAQASEAFAIAMDAEIEKFKASGSRKSGTNVLAYFPAVQDLDAKITAFLIPARRVVTEICQVPNLFWNFKRQHSDASHLLEKELVPVLGPDHNMVKWLTSRVPMIKCIIDFRNGQEHTLTTKGAALLLKNFTMLPTNDIEVPTWGLEGTDMTDVRQDVAVMLEFLTNLAEVMLVACIDANRPQFPPMSVVRNSSPEATCPIRFQLVIDPNKLFETMGAATSPPAPTPGTP